MDNRINYKETTFGFEYGSARVERIASDGKKGWVYFSILTPKNILYLYVTKTGRVKITDEKRVEWLPENGKKPVEMPPLPDGLDDENINHYHFKQGWVECWKAIESKLKGQVEADRSDTDSASACVRCHKCGGENEYTQGFKQNIQPVDGGEWRQVCFNICDRCGYVIDVWFWD